jgi:serine/threonine protein kinase
MATVIAASAVAPTPGEARALEALKALPSQWVVIANKILPIRHDDSREIDFIVIAPNRVFVIDEKSYRGNITGTDQVWTLERSGNIPSPFNKIDFVAKICKAWIDTRVTGFASARGQVFTVVGGILLSHPEVNARISDVRASRCLFLLDNVCERLQWLNDQGKRAGIDLLPIKDAIRQSLYNLNEHHRPKHPERIGTFTTVEHLDERNGCRVYSAVNDAGESRRLYLYQNDETKPNELDRELVALRKLQQSHLVARVGDAFLWDDDSYLVVPVDAPRGQALGLRPLPSSEQAALGEIELAARLFAVLGEIHAQGITHRSLGPSALYIDESAQDRITITDFKAARLDSSQTIHTLLDQKGFDDPYAAPEIVNMESYAFADQTSDVFSLALITLERLMALNVSDIRTMIAEKGTLSDEAQYWPYFSHSAVQQLRNAYAQALTAGPYTQQPRPSAQQMAVMLKGVAKGIREQIPWSHGEIIPNTHGEPQYRIEGLLGEGTSAQTYLVWDIANEFHFAGKRFFRQEALTVQSEPIREFRTLFEHQHKHLPRPISPPEIGAPFLSKIEYIRGETLRSRLAAQGSLPWNKWIVMARQLLSAANHLEQHGVLHRDIKPENIMLQEGDDFLYLIDYGASARSDDALPLAGTPRYWPPEWRLGDQHPAGADRYAVAVTLFESLTGQFPFKTTNAVTSNDPLDLETIEIDGNSRAVAAALLKAVAIDSSSRFSSFVDFEEAIERALRAPTLPVTRVLDNEERQHTLEWIDNLRGLYRNSRRGNSDNRGLDSSFARETYIQTSLDDRLWPAILEHRPAVVFLSGNPGDGKTAFLERVLHQFTDAGVSPADPHDSSGWTLISNGHEYRACFDASESVGSRTADEQLADRLHGHEGSRPNPALTVLVAINDGRMHEVIERFSVSFPWLVQELQQNLQGLPHAKLQESLVWIIDLKQRSYVALHQNVESPSVMRRMLEAMVDPDNWQGLEASSDVRVYNASALGRSGKDAPASRFEHLLLLAHLRGERHTTIRDLRSALAYAITNDLSQNDIDARDPGVFPFPWSGKYWNTIFSTQASHDLVLGELQWLDPARFAHPELERFLYFHSRPEDATLRAALFQDGQDEPPPAGATGADLRTWIGAVKRRMVLEGALMSDASPLMINPLDLLPYQSAYDFIRLLSEDTSSRPRLLKRLLCGMGRSDQLAEAFSQEGLVLRVSRSESGDVELVKIFPISEFSLDVQRAAGQHVKESTPRLIWLVHDSGARLSMNFDLVEVLTRFASGLDPSSRELQPFIEELGPFKSQLQRYSTDKLLVIEHGRRHWVIKDGENIVRQDA